MHWLDSHPPTPNWIEHLHSQHAATEAFFDQAFQQTPAPILSSVDIRFSGHKMAAVDTNVFPAGLNNLAESDLTRASQALIQAIKKRHPHPVERIAIIPENHTRNIFYFQHLERLEQLLTRSGYDARILSLNPEITQPTTFEGVTLHPLNLADDLWQPELLLINHDGSGGVPEALENLTIPCLPPLGMMWASRQKSSHFRTYRNLADQLCDCAALDPWHISCLFNQCSAINFKRAEGLDCIAHHCHALLQRLRAEYATHGITTKPFLAIKADRGTYGMGVMMVEDDNPLTFNRRQRSHMASQKGGGQVDRVLIQEGIPSAVTRHNHVTEVTVYLAGPTVIGGFFRHHATQHERSNLNGPGMQFTPIEADAFDQKHPYGHAYQTIARLAALAAAHEMAYEI